MEKKEFQKVVRDKMKQLGFQGKKTCLYKIIDDDYLIGVCLDHHPFCRGYYIEYSVVYLPDEEKMPFWGFCDWDDSFQFSKNSENDSEEDTVDYFEYDIRDTEELIRELDINIEKRLSLLYDKNYVVEYYMNNLDMFIMLPEKTIRKILKLGDFDIAEINRLREKWGYDLIIL